MSVLLNENSRLQLPQDVRPQIGDEQYYDLQPYIDSAKAFAQITYKSLYIINYNRMNFLYVSDNPLFLCGENVEKVQQEGYNFYYQHVPEEDLSVLTQVNRAGFEFLRGIAVSERSQYTISYNFRITQKKITRENLDKPSDNTTQIGLNGKCLVGSLFGFISSDSRSRCCLYDSG